MSKLLPWLPNPTPSDCVCNAGTSWHALRCPAGERITKQREQARREQESR